MRLQKTLFQWERGEHVSWVRDWFERKYGKIERFGTNSSCSLF
jgi:hypothetical protein|tara:strand:+ start:8649 stop:8777 length:129 start_codon:yes stop_codon:yes gene_type:complete